MTIARLLEAKGYELGMVFRFLALAVGVLTIGACGDNPPATQPVPNVTTLERGVFDDLPLVPRSEPFGTRSEEDGVVARSYRARGIAPADVIAFYANALRADGWTRTKPVYREPSSMRADWVRDDTRLELSVTPATNSDGDSSDEYVVQYSLVLRPRA